MFMKQFNIIDITLFHHHIVVSQNIKKEKDSNKKIIILQTNKQEYEHRTIMCKL